MIYFLFDISVFTWTNDYQNCKEIEGHVKEVRRFVWKPSSADRKYLTYQTDQ